MPAYVYLLVALLALAAIVLWRTVNFGKTNPPVEPFKAEPVDGNAVAEHLSSAIRCQTVSNENHLPAADALRQLHHELERMYPRIHTTLQRQLINEFSLLYHWQGSDPALIPILFMAHQDVVPIDPSSLSEWQHPPFSGEVADGFVWGRGALDIKNQLIAVMEAVETLLERGFQPRRSIYLAFGHDEEISGHQGAAQIAAWFKEQGIELEAVVDEGVAVVKGILPGVSSPVALVGNAEKGYLTLELSVEQAPGHSSTPPRQTAIGILAAALTRLEANPLPTHIQYAMPMFEAAGKELPFLYRLGFANQWLLGGVIRSALEDQPATNAAMRTTTAVTIINGGLKDNILPPRASASVNFRLIPGESISDVITHVQRVVDDSRVKVQPVHGSGWESSPVSPTDSPAFKAIDEITRQVFGDVIVAPFLMLGATDARYYSGICPQVYRFSPLLYEMEDMKRVHGINERISLENLERMVQFFTLLMQRWGQA
jgi:carboxypeptidase PM20D1